VTIDELRAAIAAMLDEERKPAIDWERVESLSSALIARLVNEPAPEYPFKLFHFIEDWDVRRKDERLGQSDYAERQRGLAERFIRGE
jgi:hypothetical protein